MLEELSQLHECDITLRGCPLKALIQVQHVLLNAGSFTLLSDGQRQAGSQCTCSSVFLQLQVLWELYALAA